MFLDVWSGDMYDKHVQYPINAEEVQPHLHEFEIAGKPGNCDSCNTTHVMLMNCPHHLTQAHTGKGECTNMGI